MNQLMGAEQFDGIRKIWDETTNEYWYAVVDVLEMLHVAQQGDGLQGLAEAHLVGQDGAVLPLDLRARHALAVCTALDQLSEARKEVGRIVRPG